MRLLAILLFLALGGVARADYPLPHADLLCDRNVALARFTMADERDSPEYAVLPAKLDRGLSKRQGADRTDCRLANGANIRIRVGEEQAFPYGAGGGDPPAFFSLWIDHRRLLSRHLWKPGYDDATSNKPWLVGLVIRPHSLTFCYRRPDGKAVRCERQRLDASKHAVDAEEYPTNSKPKPVVGTVLIEPASADAATCQRYLDSMKKDAKGAIYGLPYDSRLSDSMTYPDGPRGQYAPQVLDGKFTNIGDRRVVVFGSTNHYFDGDIIVLAPHDTSLDEIVAAFPGEDIEQEVAKPKPGNWTVISGGQPGLYPKITPRYVHFVPETIDGELLYLAYPTNENQRPTGILIKPAPTEGFVSLCSYQRVEPHY
jgi:hypothetical protein